MREKRFYPSMMILLLPFLGCSSDKKKEEAIDDALVHEVSRGDLIEEVIESGKITPWFEVKIKSKISGEVRLVHVKEGEVIKKGQPLLEIDDVEYRRQVTLAEVDSREATLRLDHAKFEEERCTATFASNGISKYELDKARHVVAQAQVQLERARVALTTRRDQVGYATIHSPIDGVVTKRNIEPGEVITAGVNATLNGEPLLTVAQLDKMLIELSVNQIDVGKVKIGQKTTITLDAYRDTPLEGEVTAIAASANSDQTKGVDVFKVKVSINPSTYPHEIKPGMTGEVKIHIGNYPNVVKIPIESIFEKEGNQYVYLIKEEGQDQEKKKRTKEKTKVVVGHRGMEEMEITEGLTVGQKIYAAGESKEKKSKDDDE